ncbi:MAG: GntR family transcriptional regulator [Thermodesulfobacteriota bacterium]
MSHTQKAYMGIRRMLFHNEIAPGQKISARDLAERLGMSPTPVIQALNRLEHQGLVRRETNRGYYSEPISIKQVEEVYDLRQTLEVALIPKVVKNLAPDCFKRLRAALKAYQNAVRDLYLNDRLLKDMDYHLTLASISQDQTHVQVLRQMFDLLYLRNRGSVLFSIPSATVDKEHEEILKALANKDVKKVQDILTVHISNKKKLVLEGLSRMMAEKQGHAF